MRHGRTERYELLLHLGLALTPSDPAQAVSCYRQALEIPLDTRVSLGARLNLAARLMEQGQLEEAISLTQTATQRPRKWPWPGTTWG